MTTPPDNATATAEAQVEQVATAQETVAEAVQQVEQEEVSQPSYATIEAVRQEIGALQGTIAQRTGQDRKNLENRIAGLESAISQLVETTVEARLAAADPEEREQLLRAEVERLRTARTTPPADEPQQQDSWLPEAELGQLAGYTEALIQQHGLNTTRGDSRLWAGAVQGMNVQQLQQVVARNAAALAPPRQRQAPPPATPAVEPPPTMQSAPTNQIKTYTSRKEVADDLAEGILGSEDARAIYKENGWA